MSEYMTVVPKNYTGGTCFVPSSKPETQRAIIVASLADGASTIKNDLRCLETTVMKQAFSNLGAEIAEGENLYVRGMGGRICYKNKVIDAKGSGLVFRVATALASVSSTPIVLTGDASLRPRVMQPLFDCLTTLGSNIEYLAEVGKAPVINWGGHLHGGKVSLPGNISSQFITALLLAAPLSKNGITLDISGEILSKSYIRQTLHFMRLAGLQISCSESLNYIEVPPGIYQPISVSLSGDMTSASYLLALATIFPGNYRFLNMNSKSLQGEKYFLDVIKTLGVDVQFNDDENIVSVNNRQHQLKGEYIFDVSDCPNIIPTLAALGAFVEGSFTVKGGSITRLHKSNRIQAMVTELSKVGVDIQAIYNNGIYDGFTIKGRSHYEGGEVLSSWGDHRIFMSLYIFSLKARMPNKIDGFEDVICSFPTFFDEISKLAGN